MKSIPLIGMLCLVALSSIFSAALAQDKANNIVPQAVSTAFKTRYPQARVKSCKQNKIGYTIKFRLNNKDYHALFDQQGNWSQTVSNVSWQWRLPSAVKTGLRKSLHGNWHPYGVNLIETASEQYYRVMVDNSNHPIDAEHQLVLTQNWEIDVNSAGKVINEKYID